MNLVEILNADGTPVRSGRRRRHRRARRRLARVALVLAATAAILLGVGLLYRGWVEASRPEPGLPDVAAPAPVETRGSPATRGTRVVHPYSIVPGGVQSAEDARGAAAIDDVVAEHYRDVALDALRPEIVTRSRAVYVSYRRGNNVFWTKRRLLLKPGEMLLSDGKNEVRARCGNRVSDSAQDPVSAVEDPTTEVFDQSAPIVVPEVLASRSLGSWQEPPPYIPPPLEADPLAAALMVLPGFGPFVRDGLVAGRLVAFAPVARVGDPGAFTIDDPGNFEPVPEPGTLTLVGLGLAAVVVRLRRIGARRTGSRLNAGLQEDANDEKCDRREHA